MGYNPITGILTDPEGVAEVQEATGNASDDMATLCAAPSVNPMAKYKPVRYDKEGDLTDTERASTRYGFGTQIPTFTGGDTDPDNTWEYQRVRPGTDWARITDFNGYYSRACVPFAMQITGSLQDAIGITIFRDSYAGAIRGADEGNGESYEPDYNLSLADLYPSGVNGNATTSSYVALCIHDLDKGDSICVVTNRTLADILGATVPTITIYGTEQDYLDGGITYPAVAMLHDATRSGHTFRFIIGLIGASSAPASTYGYKVYTSSTSPSVNALILYSMAFRAGCDRKDMILLSSHSIRGLKFVIQNASLSLTHAGQVEMGGTTCQKYTLSGTVLGTFTTPKGHWSPQYTRVVLLVNSDSGWVEDKEGNRSPEFEEAVDISDNNNGQGRTSTITLFQFYDNYADNVDVTVYFPHKERGTVKLTARVNNNYENVYADNIITVQSPSIK